MKITRTVLAPLVLLLATMTGFAADATEAKRSFAAHKTMAVIVLEPALISGNSETSADVMFYLGEFKKKNPSISVFTLSRSEYRSIFFGPPMLWKNAAVFIQPNGDGLVIPTYILDESIYDDAVLWLNRKKMQNPDPSWEKVPVQTRKP